MQYTVDYFIKKFEAIPEDKWCGDGGFRTSSGKACAYGHCDASGANSQAGKFLTIVFAPLWKVREGMGCISEINDGADDRYQQPTPKQRVLAALYDIKKMQEPKVKEVIRYVSVSASLKKQIVLIGN